MTSASDLSQAALSFVGHPYVYGGARPSGWDCSGFVNWLLCHYLGIGIPGFPAGSFDGSTHGPVVSSYASWSGATTVGKPGEGVLCIWNGLGPDGHIGVAISESRMVSALDPAAGTVETPIIGEGPAGAPLMFRTINAVTGGGPNSVATGDQQQLQQLGQQAGCLPGAALLYRMWLLCRH